MSATAEHAPPLVLTDLWNGSWHLFTATPWAAIAVGLLLLAKLWHDVYLVVPAATLADDSATAAAARRHTTR